MSLFELFATVASVVLAWVILSFPYLIEKLLRTIWSR